MPGILSSSLAVLIALGVACGSSSPPESTAEDGVPPLTIQVVSHNFNDVDVYAFIGSGRRYLGTAMGHGVSMFKIPWRRLNRASRFGLVARQVGDAREVSSGWLGVSPGNNVVWTLETNLAFTSVAVY